MITQHELFDLLEDPEVQRLVEEAGLRVLDPSEGWSSDATRALLQRLRDVISERWPSDATGSPRSPTA